MPTSRSARRSATCSNSRSNEPQLTNALTEIETLLRAYGHVYGANLAMIARETFAHDPLAACAALDDPDWWGGRDSIAAMDLALDGGFSPEARADGQRLRAALVEVCSTMKGYGIENEQAEIVTAQFVKWRSSQV